MSPSSSELRFQGLVALSGLILLAGCQGATPTLLAPTPEPVDTSIPSSPVPIETVPSTPSPSPVRYLILGVPDRWVGEASEVIQRLEGSDWVWQLDAGGDPEAKLQTGVIQLALVLGEEGLPAGQRPLALAVHFTSEWEMVDRAEAGAILNEGNPAVAVMDWDQLTPNLKALRVEGRLPSDADYPLQESWSLLAAPGYEGAATEIAPLLAEAISRDPVIHIAAVGDVMLDRAPAEALRKGDLGHPFEHVAHLLLPADLAVANLESALGDLGSPENKGYTFQAPPQAAASLAQAGFDVLSLANNHAMDYGPQALLEAQDLLLQEGLLTVGAGRDAAAAHSPQIVEINGISLAALAYVDVPVEVRGFDTRTWIATDIEAGVAWADPVRIRADVQAVALKSDLVIVLLHSGYEYVLDPSPPQTTAARAAIEAGADLVIGHHSHVLQGIEFYQGGVIAYGLGNFVFEDGGSFESVVLNVWLDQDGVRQLELVPIALQTDGRPAPALDDQGRLIRKSVYSLTRVVE